MRAYLDNIEILELTEELKLPLITLQKIDDTGDRAASYTGDLLFKEPQYSYIMSKLRDDPNALENKIVFKLVDDCCGAPYLEYEFYLTHKTLKWCDDTCTCTVTAEEKSDSLDQYTCFKNTVIFDNHNGFTSKQHPRMAYCNELRPNWLHHVLILVTIATWTSFLTIGPILIVVASVINTINLVIQFINSVGGSLNEIQINGNNNAFDAFNDIVNNLINQSFGCGRKHPSPLLRDYIENVCQKCGVAFQSSIINNPNSDYYNTVYVNAPINKGTQENDTTTYWIDDNAPTLSGLQLLDQLKPVFNAGFDIKNNTLYFEREDFFVPQTPWIDLSDPAVEIISLCWSWSSKERFSYAKLYYQKDAVNWVGSEAVKRWGDYVEWNNNPYSSLQKGAYEPFIGFAACRFRDDGIDSDVLTYYEDFPTIGTLFKKYKNAMLMNSHNCYLPMLLIWDGQDRENASCDKFVNINYPGLAGIVGTNQYYNFPYWFKEGYPGNLYDRFHFLKNPRISNYQGRDFEAQIKINCNLLRKIDVDGVVRTAFGDTKTPTIVTIDRAKGILTIKGTI